jgi:hypothetical protein
MDKKNVEIKNLGAANKVAQKTCSTQTDSEINETISSQSTQSNLKNTSMRTGKRTRLDNIMSEDDEEEEKIIDRSKNRLRLQILTKTPTNAAKPGCGKAPKKDIPKNNSESNKENFLVYNVSYNFKIARILKHINS